MKGKVDYWWSPIRQPLPSGLGDFFKTTFSRGDEDIVVDNHRMGSYCGNAADTGFTIVLFLERVLNRHEVTDIGEYGALDQVARMIRERYLAMVLVSWSKFHFSLTITFPKLALLIH